MAESSRAQGGRKRGRPITLKQGHRTVAVSLDPSELEWIDALVATLRSSGIQGQGPTRSSVIRSAVRGLMEECNQLSLTQLLPRFPGAAFDGRNYVPEPKRSS